MSIVFKEKTAASIAAPAAGKTTLYIDDTGKLRLKDDASSDGGLAVMGNVGIGVASTTHKLEVARITTGFAQYCRVSANAAGTCIALNAEVSGALSTLSIAGYFAAKDAATNYAVMIEANWPPAGANNYAIRSESAAQSYFAGNVGIGVVPAAKLDVLGASLTGAAADSIVNLAQTWNTTGTPTAIKLNVTDTASNANSLFMDLQVGGASKLNIDKFGAIRGGLGFRFAGDSRIHEAGDTTFASPRYYFQTASNSLSQFLSIGFAIMNAPIAFTATANAENGHDLFILRDAANVFAQRNAANPQAFRLYNTYTNTTNYERGFLRWNTNVLEIGAEAAGTGTARNVSLLSATSFAPPALTGAAATSALDIAQTWNTTGTPTAIKANITDTASNAASLLMDLQVGGASQCAVTKSGVFLAGPTSGGQCGFSFLGDTGTGFFRQVANEIYYYSAQAAFVGFPRSTDNFFRLKSTTSFSWTSGDPSSTLDDLTLYRDAANTLAQRNAANAQAFRIYNTYTDASNYERLGINWASNVLRIDAEKLGTGVQRDIALQTAGGSVGIGTTAPQRTLQLGSIAGTNMRLDVANIIEFYDASTRRGYVFHSGTLSIVNEVAGNGIKFIAAAKEILTLDPTNAVGVNNTAPGAQLHVKAAAAATIGGIMQGFAAQTANLAEWQDSAAAIHATVTENGYITTRKTAAPADAELVAGEAAYWFDQTDGAARFMVKAKSANGTVVTGTLLLT